MKRKEGTKSDDSFPERGHSLLSDRCIGGSTSNRVGGQEEIDGFLEGAQQAKRAGDRLIRRMAERI